MEVIKPQEGGQTEFLSRKEFEVLFGGAAGGGKSFVLVIDALGLQYQTTVFGAPAIYHRDYRAVLFRRKTTQLSKLLDEAKKYYPSFGATFVQGRRGDPGSSFSFPSGARIFFCHMEDEKNKEDHQGIEYQYVGFDELTQFTVTQYMYLFSRLRSTLHRNGGYLPCRVRSTTNPTGTGLGWVKRRFIKNGIKEYTPKQTYLFKPDPINSIEDNPCGIEAKDKWEKNVRSRVFIPGLLHENKILMESDPDYASNIMAMGKKYERALLLGDWDAFGGTFFDDFSRAEMSVEPFDIPKNWNLIGSLDPGWASPCSFGLTARDLEGNVYRLFTYYEKGRSPEQNANAIMDRIKSFPQTKGRMPDTIISGRDAFAHKDRYSMNTSELTLFDVFNSLGMYLLPAVTDRINGWWVMKNYMRNKKFFIFNGMNDPLVEEIQGAEHDPNNPEDIKGGGNDRNVPDHALDECRYGLMSLPNTIELMNDRLPQWAKKKLKTKYNDYSVMGA